VAFPAGNAIALVAINQPGSLPFMSLKM
jgi:hypothetical protein